MAGEELCFAKVPEDVVASLYLPSTSQIAKPLYLLPGGFILTLSHFPKLNRQIGHVKVFTEDPFCNFQEGRECGAFPG